MHNDVDAIVVACLGTLVDWSRGIEAVAYELARGNGESPMDRGAALRRRVDVLSRTAPGGPCLATGFDRLAAERGWRRGPGGATCRRRVVALSRPYPDAPRGLEPVFNAGLPLIVLSRADRVLVEGALRPLDGAFHGLICAADLGGPGAPDVLLSRLARYLGTAPRRLLHVSASRAAITAAGSVGMRRAWVDRGAAGAPPRDLRADEAWDSLDALPDALGLRQGPLPVAR